MPTTIGAALPIIRAFCVIHTHLHACCLLLLGERFLSRTDARFCIGIGGFADTSWSWAGLSDTYNLFDNTLHGGRTCQLVARVIALALQTAIQSSSKAVFTLQVALQNATCHRHSGAECSTIFMTTEVVSISITTAIVEWQAVASFRIKVPPRFSSLAWACIGCLITIPWFKYSVKLQCLLSTLLVTFILCIEIILVALTTSKHKWSTFLNLFIIVITQIISKARTRLLGLFAHIQWCQS
jgi:hypothetical protein